MSKESPALSYRHRYRGLVGVKSKMPIKDMSVLSRIYTPGVDASCREIDKNPLQSFDQTCRGNSIAVISDGSRVYGLGNIGALAVLPKLEAKSVVYKTFANVDAVPIALKTQDADEITEIVRILAPTFGGFCLESIAAPKCFTIVNRLRRAIKLPIVHHEQHGAAIIILAALTNALKVVGKNLTDVRIVISGAGAAGIGVAKGLLVAGAKNIIVCDRHGAIHVYRMEGMNRAKSEIARLVKLQDVKGSLAQVLKGAEVFIGLSGPNLLNDKMVKSMAPDPIVFALANPVPEIHPKEAKKAGASIVATGRSDFPNQVNNCLAFPGIFRGALDIRARAINDAMNIAAAKAIADLTGDELSPSYILSGALDFRVPPAVAEAVARAGMETGEARLQIEPERVARHTREFIYDERLSLL